MSNTLNPGDIVAVDYEQGKYDTWRGLASVIRKSEYPSGDSYLVKMAHSGVQGTFPSEELHLVKRAPKPRPYVLHASTTVLAHSPREAREIAQSRLRGTEFTVNW